MLNIQLNEKYFINSDERNYILVKKRIATQGKNKGKEILVNVGYFGNVEHLLKRLVENEIKESDITELKQINSLINKITTDISQNIHTKLS